MRSETRQPEMNIDEILKNIGTDGKLMSGAEETGQNTLVGRTLSLHTVIAYRECSVNAGESTNKLIGQI